MVIEKYIKNFWYGRVKLWQSFWLVGGIGGIIIGRIIIFIKESLLSDYSLLPIDFSFRIKILITAWVIYSTVGIWRSAEFYQGPSYWKVIVKIYIAMNCISTFFLLFFFRLDGVY
ncbi:MAG: hypothetical protein CFH21_01156 [Alphaproteobacteria bacterium MarineAlpha5_Bin11]|nr:hypothetical protein [Pelagibacteraceae bacterium]PPR42287.1 MAG: hypothetical protein CFH21_01156 [Alphaproteobacteria bacterium MarineAlpha5_Bin11]|tara:strand:+ start:11694 stop:12038 length:345 start_codon:yes stop_codon:yes gene_type:complete